MQTRSQAAPPAGPPARRPGDVLRERFNRFRVENLNGISPADFEARIQSMLVQVDAAAEGYAEDELDRQRDLSVKFHWGHDHDFGSFRLPGRMADRHFYLLEHFLDLFPVTLRDFQDADVFDIGCWTGGTALMLAALGARVYAIEEVRKYADTARFLAGSFGVADRVTIESRSLYSFNDAAFYDRFDVVHFPGVIYHLSDPLIGLRILFNSLKPGGKILIETAGIDHPEPFCRFDGSLIHTTGSREQMNRAGWNWFMPSASALDRMMREAGFEQTKCLWHEPIGRIYGYGVKSSQVGICRAGLSVPWIR